MALQELTLELSLKPFLRRNAPPLREVCRELLSAWNIPAICSSSSTGDGMSES